MSIHSGYASEVSDQRDVFINEDDIVHEYDIDGQVLPDQDDDDMELEGNSADDEVQEEAIDSIYSFDRHIPDDEVQEEAIDSIYSFDRHILLPCDMEHEVHKEAIVDMEHECSPYELYTVACSPVDPFLVATGSRNEKAFLWKIGNPDAVIELQGHKESVSSVAFSHDGQLLASGCYDGSIRVWDAALGTLKFTLECSDADKEFEWVKWHPKGHLIVAGSEDSEDSSIYMWNADKGVLLSSFSGHVDVVTCGGFTPDGKVLCAGSHKIMRDGKKVGTMRIWNPKTGECVYRIAGHNYHQASLSCMEITADSTTAITGAVDGSLHMVNLSSGQVVSSLEGHTDSIECIGISPSFGFAATGGMDKKLIIWELQRSSPRCICDHKGGVTCVAWLGMTRYVASGCMDGKVRIWDSLSGNCEKNFTGHGSVHKLAPTADGSCIVSVTYDGFADVFHV